MPGPHSVSPSDFSILCDVIAVVARTAGLPKEDADDFTQHVHLRLLEKNYAPLAMFAGQSSLRTYLTVVVRRLLLDWRNARFGKWRPSSVAKRLGTAAVDLDRLIWRDGHPVSEAVAMLEGRPGVPDGGTLRAIAAQLPPRRKVRVVAADDLEPLAAVGFDDPVARDESAAASRDLLRALRRACRALPQADRRLLHLRYARRLAVSEIAVILEQPAKPLYRQLERIVATLRRVLAAEGVLKTAARTQAGRARGPQTTAVH